MTARVILAAALATLAGCAAPEAEQATPTPTPTPVPSPPASEACVDLTVRATPAKGPAAMPRVLAADLTNCGSEVVKLAHACARGMDIRLHVLYNSTDPQNATAPGVGPRASYLVDNPIANRPLACATAPPHVREVPAGYTLPYAVEWSGLVGDPACTAPPCERPLTPGRYLVSASAEDAETGTAYLATAWIELT